MATTALYPRMPKMVANTWKFATTVLCLQVIFIVCFAAFVRYGEDLDASHPKNYYLDSSKTKESNLLQYYPMFQDINMMIFFGVGFLYTFLGKYGYSGIGMNFIISGIAMQWSMLTQNWFNAVDGKIHLDITSLVTAEFAAASAVIAVGGVFAKVGPLQIVFFTLLEVLIYTANEYFCVFGFKVADIGDSVSLHVFAAIFGCATAYALDKNVAVQNNPNEKTSYNSNLFAMVGTLVLWAFWPSINAALAAGSLQHRCVINTYLALVGSCITVFAVSSLLHKEYKFTMSHIQNATIAGGVGIGATCDLMVQPYGALLIGSISGGLSVLGFKYVSPFLAKLKIYDLCGINCLHAIPGFFSGITSIFMALMATEEMYGHNLYKLYPAMAPAINTTSLKEMQFKSPDVQPGIERTAILQACFQLVYIIEVIVIAVITGLATGSLLKLRIFDPLNDKQMFLDGVSWVMPDHKEDASGSAITDSEL